MRTLLRFLILILLVVWIGAIAFFPITAWMAFSTLPTPHLAGTVTGESLRILYNEGLIAGILLIVFLFLSRPVRAYRRSVIPAVVLVAIMLGLTAYSQFGIVPRMERDRIQAGGAIDSAPVDNPYRKDFDQLHHESVMLFGVMGAAGFLVLIWLAWATDVDPQKLASHTHKQTTPASPTTPTTPVTPPPSATSSASAPTQS